MITSIRDAPKDVGHVVVAECVHVRLRLVADHGVEVAERPAENGHTLRLTALVEGTVRDGRVSDGRRLEDVGVRLPHTDHHHTRLVDVRVRVDHTPVDACVLQTSVFDLKDPPFACWF